MAQSSASTPDLTVLESPLFAGAYGVADQARIKSLLVKKRDSVRRQTLGGMPTR